MKSNIKFLSELKRRYKVKIYSDIESMANISERIIFMDNRFEKYSKEWYVVLFHELGHIIVGLNNRRNCREELRDEISAWLWAYYNFPSYKKEIYSDMKHCLNLYKDYHRENKEPYVQRNIKPSEPIKREYYV